MSLSGNERDESQFGNEMGACDLARSEGSTGDGNSGTKHTWVEQSTTITYYVPGTVIRQ
jgi:hypothetical protein